MTAHKRTRAARPPINRLDHKDVEKKFLLTWDLLQWLETETDRLDVSHSAYIRDLIKKDREEKLLQAEAANNSSNPEQILTGLIGLLTEHPELARLLEKLLAGRK